MNIYKQADDCNLNMNNPKCNGTHIAEAEPFEASGPNGIEKALEKCESKGYDALFIPQIAERRIRAQKHSYLLTNRISSPSIIATGKTKGGKPVVVYGHLPNYFSCHAHIMMARNEGLKNGAGRMPLSHFYRLLDQEDKKNVFVADYGLLKNAECGPVKLANAIRHPQAIPFLGGKEKTEAYLEKHKDIYGNMIGIWHCDDLYDNVPLARLLGIGNGNIGLDGNNAIDFSEGRVLGHKRQLEARLAEI